MLVAPLASLVKEPKIRPIPYKHSGPIRGRRVVNAHPYCHIQNITVSKNFGREQLLELGRKAPYHRFVSFPLNLRSKK